MRATLLCSISICLAACAGSASREPIEPVRGEPPRNEPRGEPGPSLSRLMVEAVRGERSLASVVDRDRGLVYVLWQTDASDEDPRADEQGVIRQAERLCGEDLDAAIARLDADLQRRNQDPSDEPSISCVDETCSHRALMEFDVMGEYVFVRGAQPAVLDHVVHIEGHLTDEATSGARRWVDERLSELAGGSCAR